ncbi:hypothetical protein N789_02225 [Arenimonas oryziterrae DSM 21050 = YC6267]|uniref:Uncharacterized protein n=1 Tax=Arenimonas oryziterrae DSM 21050 = YC6267 TaxID=1121015 RepID=A0A091B1R8_9GAMM|nr:hypothetical protein N789_02225 [Arenimonas oryziterrae DSM 21050 = YC6267]
MAAAKGNLVSARDVFCFGLALLDVCILVAPLFVLIGLCRTS